MAIKLTFERQPDTNELLSIYYELSEGDVARTVELDENCLLDLDDINHPVGLELVGPFSVGKAQENAALYCSPELDQILMHLAGERNLVRA
jgi:hypothetical protein